MKARLVPAKTEGKQLGRPKSAPKVEKEIRADLEAGGLGVQKLARKHGVGVGTVQRFKAELGAALTIPRNGTV